MTWWRRRDPPLGGALVGTLDQVLREEWGRVLATLIGFLGDFRYLHSTRAELLRRLGRTSEARDAYRRARQLTDDGAERRFLERRLTELSGP